MAEASDRLAGHRRRRISIYVGRWQATPRWFLWKPKWRRRVLEYKGGFRTDADYVWQYATPIKLVNFEAQPSPQAIEAQPWVEARPSSEAIEALSRTEHQPPPETTDAESQVEGQLPPEVTTIASRADGQPPPEATEVEAEVEAQPPAKAAEALSRTELPPPPETPDAESRTGLQPPFEATEGEVRSEPVPPETTDTELRSEPQSLLETTAAESRTELEPPPEAAEAGSRTELQPPLEVAEAESPTETQPPPEATEAESPTELQPPLEATEAESWTELQPPSEATDPESRTKAQPPVEATRVESWITDDEESRPPDRPISPGPGAALGAGESDQTATSGKPPEEGDEDAGAHDKAAEESRKRRRPWVVLIGLLVLALLIAGGVYYWWSTRSLESTDDAYTDGRAITIAPQVAGEVVALDINDNEFVKQGQALIHIDPRQYKNDQDQAEGALATAKAQHAGQQLAAEIAHKNFPALLDQAKAQLESAKASLAKTQADYARQISLQRPATTQQDVDQATTARWQAEAQVKLAEAQVKQNSPVPQQIGQSEAQVKQLKGQVEQAQARLYQAELNLSWTTVAAPQDGWITRRNVEKGNYVVAGQQILSIVTPDVWVTANFKETQLTYMRPGQPVKIRIDAFPSLDVRGHVDSIQRGSGSKFTAFPPENATGNFVKIVQRVPVKIIIDSGIPPDIPMPLGISVVPTVTVR